MSEKRPEKALPAAGVQGWLFDRPPQDAQWETMKPPRRLGKGLADLVELHGSGGRKAADDGDDAAPVTVLDLLSTETLERPTVKPAVKPAVKREPAAAPVEEPSPAPEPVAEEPAPVAEAAPPEPAPAPEPPEREPEPVAEPVQEAAPAAPAFEDEWFDPPIADFSPVAGFQRETPSPAPVEAVREEPVAPPEPEPPRVERAPEPPPEPEPERTSEPAFEDPVIVDDGVLFDDVVVASYLPEVDLDS